MIAHRDLKPGNVLDRALRLYLDLIEEIARVSQPWVRGTLTIFVVGYFANLAACSNLQPAIRTANEVRRSGHELAVVIEQLCTIPYERAAEASEEEARRELARLDGMKCPAAFRAQTALAQAHGLYHATLTAIQAGECAAAFAPRGELCDLPKATAKLIEAGAEVARAVERIEARK